MVNCKPTQCSCTLNLYQQQVEEERRGMEEEPTQASMRSTLGVTQGTGANRDLTAHIETAKEFGRWGQGNPVSAMGMFS